MHTAETSAGRSFVQDLETAPDLFAMVVAAAHHPHVVVQRVDAGEGLATGHCQVTENADTVVACAQQVDQV